MRILVVEDEPALRQQLLRAITAAGHTAEAACDGIEAHYLGDSESFDAVVLDLGLPQLDGLPVVQALFAHHRAPARAAQRVLRMRRYGAGPGLSWRGAGCVRAAGQPDRQRRQVGALARGRRRADEQLQLSIDDDGPGIASAARARMCQRGVQLDERHPGAGLGLDIVRELAKTCGSSVQIQTSGLGGARLVLLLPQAQA